MNEIPCSSQALMIASSDRYSESQFVWFELKLDFSLMSNSSLYLLLKTFYE